MSKRTDGSITPRTVRRKIDFRVTEEQAIDLDKYDNMFLNQYEDRNQKRSEILQRKEDNVQMLGQLGHYYTNGPFKGLIAQFNKKADYVLKTTENLERISSDQIAEPLEFIKIFQYRENDHVPSLEFDSFKPTVRHYGINAHNSSIFIEHIIRDDQLHPVEASVFNKALAYLKDKSDAQTFFNIRRTEPQDDEKAEIEPFNIKLPKPNNVVLVSFFPRSGNESDKFLLEGLTVVADTNVPTEAETHTIILWKTGPREITIIDPTDRTFSQFLENILNSSYQNINFRIENTNVEGVNGTIYKPKHNSNKNLLEYARDCTDIAVKIAFELNESQTNLAVDSVDLALIGTIEQISNANLPKDVGLFRALQSSDFDIRIEAKKLIDCARSCTKELIDKDKKSFEKTNFLNALDITKITTLEEIQEVSRLLGDLNIEDIYI